MLIQTKGKNIKTRICFEHSITKGNEARTRKRRYYVRKVSENATSERKNAIGSKKQ